MKSLVAEANESSQMHTNAISITQNDRYGSIRKHSLLMFQVAGRDIKQ
jgi:hypothetical protein